MPRNTTLLAGRLQGLIDGVFQEIDAILETITPEEARTDKRLIKLMSSINKMKLEKDTL